MNKQDKRKNFKQLGISAAALLVAAGIATALIYTKPKAKKQEREETTLLVETIKPQMVDAPVTILAQGRIEPATSIRILAEVSGEIVYGHADLAKGGVIKKGDVLLRIDPKEYELSLAQKKSALASARLNLAIERAQKEVAQAEYDRRRDHAQVSDDAKALATRAYYLDKAQGEYDAAVAEVERAELNLKKTVIRSPIDAMIASVAVNVGEFIFAQSQVAKIYGTDEFLAEVSIPVAELAHIVFSDLGHSPGSIVTVSQLSMNATAIERAGVVTKLLPDLGQLGHMAKIIVSVSDPLNVERIGRDQLPLLIGARVLVAIEGKNLKNVFAIPRSALNSDDTISVVDDDSKIARLALNIVRRERDFVYATGDDIAGQNIVASKSNRATAGQKVRLAAANK